MGGTRKGRTNRSNNKGKRRRPRPEAMRMD
jgi:hypothetical protein